MTGLLRSATVVCAVVSLSSAAATAVPRVRSINLTETELNLITTLLASSYEKFSGQKVTAEIDGAPEVIETLAYSLSPTGGVPILVRAQRRSMLGEVLAHAELRIETLDEAPKVCDRLAESLARKVPLETTQTRHNIAKAETLPEQRLGTEKILGVKLWFAAPVASGQAFNAIGAIMFDGRFEKETYFFELGAGFVIPGPSSSASSTGYGGFVAELGASKYLTGGNTAIYAGGGLMPRLLFSSGVTDSPLNLAPYGQFGLMVDRSSSTRLYADLRVAQNVIPIRVPSLSGAPQSAYPTELTAQVGIGW